MNPDRVYVEAATSPCPSQSPLRTWASATLGVAALACATAVMAQSAAAPTPGRAASAAPAAANEPLTVLGLWRVEQARSEPILDKRTARLDFGPDGKLTGHTSCNTLSADYKLEGTKLKIGKIELGKQRCAQLQLEQEDRILTALELADDARVRGDGLLEIRDDEFRGVLRATRFEDEAAARMPAAQ